MTDVALRAVHARPRSMALVRVAKRATDVVVGSILSVIAAPIVLLMAIGVMVTLRTTPFFEQSRPGFNGRDFRILKLRTLPRSVPRYMSKHVLRLEEMDLPRFCKLLRRTHLDELPQLLLVVTGRMSLVGPRPRLPSEVEPTDADFDRIRRTVRPGCTGLWQLSAESRNEATSAPYFDLFYINNASIRLDIWVLIRTVGWMVGLASPIDIEDIPRYLLGPGLVPSAWRRRHLAGEAARPEGVPLGWAD